MTRIALALGLTLLPLLPEAATACTMKFSEFQAHVQEIEKEARSFEQKVLAANQKVRKQSKDVRTVSYGTDCNARLVAQITETQSEVNALSDQLSQFELEDDDFFGCIVALRERGGAVLAKAQSAGDTTRVLRVQQALKELTDYDVNAINLSIQIAVTASKATRLKRETEMNLATCTPSEGGLDAIDF